MKIGLIGLGDIAKKAYLPVLSEKEGIELVLCTRNAETLHALGDKYRVEKRVQTVEELIAANIEVAFVSTATEAHYEISEKLLENGIHVYIDKPISLTFGETERIVQLAKENGKIAMVGFNRRFIPKVKELKEHGKPSFLLMQKNRFAAPDEPRRFVVEDFIHVVDTLRFLMDSTVKDVKVQPFKKGDLLHHLVIQLIGEDCTAVGIMNRDGGVTEEIIEYSAGHHKYVVNSLVETTHYHNKEMSVSSFGDWEPTLYKRGFYDLVDHFLECVEKGQEPDPSIEDSLITHEICERIVGMVD
ncbi:MULTISPECIES: Gfo/Idh/MocA family oxidoreductase [Rossellomorea]|uniref:Gfo/Idh/MocA family protein n=1 Tax=Rossellomorea TaxID=2837508 RepID=UPI001CCCE9F6|nr:MULTISPECIES: Gfo/Idh/MocA family oxidoreductase [Rossellomorea]MCA0149415.1 Gfo/Idh/MocA family oxidoreductase [Rossellomorea vietnamensis]WGG46776.1 Gfo/Idh/MocA family oxidoreductase [Rossellomorea sp. DA94]